MPYIIPEDLKKKKEQLNESIEEATKTAPQFEEYFNLIKIFDDRLHPPLDSCLEKDNFGRFVKGNDLVKEMNKVQKIHEEVHNSVHAKIQTIKNEKIQNLDKIFEEDIRHLIEEKELAIKKANEQFEIEVQPFEDKRKAAKADVLEEFNKINELQDKIKFNFKTVIDGYRKRIREL